MAGQRLLDLGEMCLVSFEELEREKGYKRGIGKDTRAMLTRGGALMITGRAMMITGRTTMMRKRLTCRYVANCSLKRAIYWAFELNVILGSTAGGCSSSTLTGCGVGVGDLAFSFPLFDDYMRVS